MDQHIDMHGVLCLYPTYLLGELRYGADYTLAAVYDRVA